MATTAKLSEKSHQGFEGIKTTLCLASMEAKSNTALGMPICLLQNGIGSRCTGKERDAETGLDYFGARYFSSPQGRFTSVDPKLTGVPFPKHLIQPQSLNMYAYALNNPLKYVDPNGEDIELLVAFQGEFSEEEKRKIREQIRGYLSKLDIGKIVIREPGDKDTRTSMQKIKDWFSGPPDFAAITFTDEKAPQNKHVPDKVFSSAFSQYRSDADVFATENADAAMHEIFAHQLRLGEDPRSQQYDLLGTDLPRDPYFGPRRGTLYDSNPNANPKEMRNLYPKDQKAIEQRLKPIDRKYEE
jgi:RHS repeat-associated protein